MKNLQPHSTLTMTFPTEFTDITHITVHNDRIYLLHNLKLYLVTEDSVTLLSDDPYDCNTTLVSLRFENKLWFGCRDRFVLYDPNDSEFSEIPAESFTAAAWNASEEHVAVVFEGGGVGTFTVDFETCQLVCLKRCSLEDGVPQTVYVGWGSENTQFRGSEGKLKKKVEVEVAFEPIEDETPRISWRGNGEMFAVNYWKEGERRFKVFEFPCTPLFECEKTRGLQGLIAWRPMGNMIACVVVDKVSSIVIFEKNGYKRFSFPLAYCDETEVTDIKWNPTGTILSVQQKSSNSSSVSLYTTSNWKWYLKQHLRYSQIIAHDWPDSLITPNLNTIRIFDRRHLYTHTFKFGINRSVTENGSTVAVIDGRKLLLTPFHKACVPPPMCVLEVGGKEGLPLNYVGFDDSGKKMVTINSDVVCRVYCLEDEEVKMVEQICVGDERKGCGFVEFFWYNGLSFMKFGEKDFYEVVRSENGCELIPTKELKPMEGNVLEQSECKIGEVIYSFKRTPDNELIYNNKTTARDVTSFLMHNRYLLFTTSKSKLFCVHLIPQQLQKLAQSRQPEDDFFTRPIEPGSTIITTIPKTSDIILQTPRGNLEIISVRAISIYILENYLSQSEWRKALTYVRSERLNANLLIDLNPLRFINEVDKFVEACETPSVLNQICLELDDGNVLVDLYRKCWIGEVVVLEGKRRKVCEAILGYLMAVDYANYIGTVVVIYVRHFGVEDALVCVQDLLERAKEDEGMLRVADEAVRTLLVYAKGEDLFKRSLALYDLNLARHIAAATSMDPNYYDPFIASLSGLSEAELRYRINDHLRRPRLALRYLLRTPTANPDLILDYMRRHDISEYLLDFPSITSITIDNSTCTSSNVTSTNTTTTSPTNTTTTSLTTTSSTKTTVAGLLGAKLSMRSRHEEAAAVYAGAGLWWEAHRALRRCGRWEGALRCLGKVEGLKEEERREAMKAMAGELVAARRWREAGRLYGEVLGEWEEALGALLEGGCFAEAIGVAERLGGDVLVQRVVKSLKTYSYNLIVRLFDAEKIFTNHRDRLQEIRKRRLEFYTNPERDYCDEQFSDLDSQTGSSRSSRYSSKSSRNRRKLERKTQDLRPGNQYENIALVRALHSLIMETMELASDVKEVSLVLLELRMIEQGRCLQEAYRKVVDLMKEGASVVWPKCLGVDYDRNNDEEAAVNLNIELLEEKYRTPPKYCGDEWRVPILSFT